MARRRPPRGAGEGLLCPTPRPKGVLADASVLSIVANLEGLDLNGLRRQWRAHLGSDAPAHLPRWLLMKVLAYRLQADAFGDLTNRSEGSFALGKRVASALLSTAAPPRRARAWV